MTVTSLTSRSSAAVNDLVRGAEGAWVIHLNRFFLGSTLAIFSLSLKHHSCFL